MPVTRKAEPYVLILPAVALMLLFLGFPLVYNVGMSLTRWQLAWRGHPFVGLQNYLRVITGPDFGRVVLNTAAWTIGGVAEQMAWGLVLALAVDSLRRRVSPVLQSFVLLPWIVPGVVTSVMWMCMLQSDLGVVGYLITRLGGDARRVLWFSDTHLALVSVMFVNTWKAMPFWFLMVTAGLMDVPRDQLEAARLDGASAVSSFRHVTLQHLKPILASTATLTTIWTFNGFDIIWTITKGGPLGATSTLPVATYILGFATQNYGMASSLAVVSVLIVAAVSAPYIVALARRLRAA